MRRLGIGGSSRRERSLRLGGPGTYLGSPVPTTVHERRGIDLRRCHNSKPLHGRQLCLHEIGNKVHKVYRPWSRRDGRLQPQGRRGQTGIFKQRTKSRTEAHSRTRRLDCAAEPHAYAAAAPEARVGFGYVTNLWAATLIDPRAIELTTAVRKCLG